MKALLKANITLRILFISISIFAQRNIQTINSTWQFHKGDIEDNSIWEPVNIPHTWNALDMLDDEPGYYRGVSWYKKVLNMPSSMLQKKVYIYFEGANQDAVVYINEKEVGSHYGGYTAFCFNITDYLNKDNANILTVKLNNSYNDDVPPVGGDLAHFGGIYRDVKIITLNSTHFDIDYFASSGVFITTPLITDAKAEIIINSRIKSQNYKGLSVKHEILSPDGDIVVVRTSKIKGLIQNTKISIDKPQMWTPSNPHLYIVKSTITNKHNIVIDNVTNPLGFRTLAADKDRGIIYNGEPIFIKGIGKHQDYDKQGYAVSNEICRNDIKFIKDMGANLVRSHYPLSSTTYDACDQTGIMVWSKIPIMDKITHSQLFMKNTKNVMQEVMYQNFNRPSFILWGFACEIFGDMDWYWPKPQDKTRVKENLELTEKFSLEMERFIREIDPSRLTANDYHTDPYPEFYKEANQTKLNMVNGWNIYQGWYHNNLDSLQWAFNEFRAYNTEVPFVIAEFGAGSDPRIHSYKPTIFDFSTEYQDMLHERYIYESDKCDFMHGLCVWTLIDFQVDGRSDAVPHINSKGLLRSDRTPKDSYYLYQANWSDAPMVHIASKDWTTRKEIVSGDIATRDIIIYSNQKEVELFVNGISVGAKQADNNKAVWSVDFVNGNNQLEAIIKVGNKIIKDFIEIDFEFVSPNCKTDGLPTNGLNINVGQSRTYLIEEESGDIWMPNTEYSKGSFGNVNGNFYTIWSDMAAWQGIREGVNQNMLGTDIDPIFQTFLIGVTDYKFDVSKGKYEISLYFAEPFSNERRLKTDQQTGADANGNRVFNVSVNEDVVFDSLNLSKQFGNSVAVIKTVIVDVDDENGVSVKLSPIKGEPVLNGERIRRIF